MDASIRIKSNTKEIEVNDNGDCISLRLGDAEFINRFAEVMRYAQETAGKMSQNVPTGSSNEVLAFVETSKKECQKIASDIDECFGDEVCKKVFGDCVPDFDLLANFFSQISILIKKFGEERSKERQAYINKHTGKYKKKK